VAFSLHPQWGRVLRINGTCFTGRSFVAVDSQSDDFTIETWIVLLSRARTIGLIVMQDSLPPLLVLVYFFSLRVLVI